MQGERASPGYFSDALNFDHGSTSSNGGIDPFGNIHSLGDNDLHAYMIANSETNTSLANSVLCEQHRFNHSEASSSGTRNEASSHNEQRRIEIIDLDPLFEQPSGANQPVQKVNYIEIPDDNPVSNRSGFFEANGQGTRISRPGRPFEDNSVRLGSSVEGRRSSHKRKSLEGSIGQSSAGGYRDYQHGESSLWTPASTDYRPVNGLSIHGSLGLGPRGLVSDSVSKLHVSSNAESSSRNLIARSNPSEQEETINPPGFSMGTVVRRPVPPSQSNLSRLLPEEQHRLDSRHEQPLENVFSWNANAPALNLPPVSGNILTPFQWPEGSLRSGSSSNSTSPVERNPHLGETRSRSISGNTLEIPLSSPAPHLRNLARRHIRRNATSGNSAPSISRTGSTTAGQPLSMSRTASTTAGQPPSSNLASNPYHNSSYYQRRRLEVARRSFPSSRAADATSQIPCNHSTLHSNAPPASLDGILLQPSGNNSQMDDRVYPRAGLSLDTQGASVSGFPHSLRALVTASRGRSRLTSSQMQNFLDVMRRDTNANLRPLEEAILQHAMLFHGAGRSHDRFRDMRLDVDNMTYEELVALGERMGDVCTGVTEETISTGLKQRKYKSSKRCPQDAKPCCICLEEYKDGEEIGTLECGHEFHSQCIKEWLKQKNLCPFCKETGLNNTPNKKPKLA